MIYDKRKLKRHNIFLIVEFRPLKSPGGYCVGITKDLSPDGFSLEAQTIDCQSGDIMEFRLKHPDAEWSVTVSGEVIWKNHSWYKFAIGIKFLNVNEEQNTNIQKLMSAVSEKADKPEPNCSDSARAEKEKVPVAISEAAAADNSLPDTLMTNAARIFLNEAEDCGPSCTEKASVRDDFGTSCEETAARDIAEIEEADKEDKKIFSAHADAGVAQNTARTTFYNIDPGAASQKKRVWLYIPFAAVIVIILVIAVPVMIKKFNDTSLNSQPELTEPAARYTEKDEAASADEGLTEPTGPSQAGQTVETMGVTIEKRELAADALGLRDNAAGNSKIDVIANIDETLKALHAMQNERPPDTGAIAETEKKKDDIIKSPKAQVTETANNTITNPDLLKKWEHIGSTQGGVPLFIAPDNTTHPYEDVVNLLVKSSVSKKEFIDLLAINCSQTKLRILEERNGANPVLSAYSDEWRDVTPDSMVLYNSACPEKK